MVTALAPHPWDAIGAPPPIGVAYDDIEVATPEEVDLIFKYALAANRVDELHEERDRLEDDISDAERDEEKAAKAIPEEFDAIKQAIHDDPNLIGNEDEVRDWLRTHRE